MISKTWSWSILLLLLFLCSKEEPPPPPENIQKPPIEVKEGAICRGIRRGEPKRCAMVFPAHVRKLYCYTRIEGAINPTFVTHLWCYKDKAMFSIDLPVKSKSWGTYSEKRIPKGHNGKWIVEILDAKQNVIQRLEFFVGTT